MQCNAMYLLTSLVEEIWQVITNSLHIHLYLYSDLYLNLCLDLYLLTSMVEEICQVVYW